MTVAVPGAAFASVMIVILDGVDDDLTRMRMDTAGSQQCQRGSKQSGRFHGRHSGRWAHSLNEIGDRNCQKWCLLTRAKQGRRT